MKPFTALSIFVFSMVALVQLLRITLKWAITVNGVLVPFWASALVCFIAAILAVTLWLEQRTRI